MADDPKPDKESKPTVGEAKPRSSRAKVSGAVGADASGDSQTASTISPPGAPPEYPVGQPAAHDADLGDPEVGSLECPVCGFHFNSGDPRL